MTKHQLHDDLEELTISITVNDLQQDLKIQVSKRESK